MEMRNRNDLLDGVEILKRTPEVLDIWLRGLPSEFVQRNEGPETWSPFRSEERRVGKECRL